MRVITIYGDEREMIVTYVSTCELQWQSNEADEGQMVARSPRLHIDHTNTQNKEVQTRTFRSLLPKHLVD